MARDYADLTTKELLATASLENLQPRDKALSNEALAEKTLKAIGTAIKHFEASEFSSRTPKLGFVAYLVGQQRWQEALSVLVAEVSFKDKLELLNLFAQKLGAAAVPLETLSVLKSVGFLVEALEFQFEGMRALAEAHRRGKRDNRIFKYAEAWVNTLLAGSGESIAADLPVQREAMQQGRSDALMTLSIWGHQAPTLGTALLAQYGTRENVRRALLTELCHRAGVSGVKFHDDLVGSTNRQE